MAMAGFSYLTELPIRYRNQPGTAMLDVANNCVWMDYRVRNWSPAAFLFLYYHELSHMLYNNPIGDRKAEYEQACDRIAADILLQMGYSPTLILGGVDQALRPSPEKVLRIDKLDSFLWTQQRR